MKRIDSTSEETKQRAQELLETDTEMVHVFPADERHCKHCGRYCENVRFDDECPALLRCAVQLASDAERKRCAQICLKEYGRWKNADMDSYGIGIGAIGATSNILCAIECIPAVSDEPVHANETAVSD